MSRTKPSPPTVPSKLQLDIVGGLHAGVSLSLEDGDYTIGSKADANFVLRDGGVAPQHAVICIEGRDIRAEAIGGALRVDGRELAQGHGCLLHLPVSIEIGEATLRLARDGEPSRLAKLWPIATAGNRPAMAAGGVLMLAITAAIASQSMNSEPPAAKPPQFALANRPAVSADGAQPANAVAEAARELEDKLSAAGIKTIRVTADGTHISGTGRVKEGQLAQWAAIQRWFDKAHAPKVVLSTNVTAGQSAATPVFRLQAVWHGERPYIIIENGQRYYEGAIFDNGWILQQIGEDRVTLRKDDETLALTYQ